MLVAEPLVRAEQATERCVELVRVDLLVCLNAVGQDLSDGLGDLCGLRHVYGRTLEIAGGIGKGQVPKTSADLGAFVRRKEDPTLALLACTASTTKTMNVGFAIAWETDLDDVRHIGEIHSSIVVYS